MQKPIHITASMYAHGIARALPISPAATLPWPRTRRSRTLLPDNNSLERGPVPSPSTHRPCDESHTQKLRKGLRSAGTEKEVCVVCPQTPEANAGGPQLGRAPDPGPVCCCQLTPSSGLAIDKALCARKDAPYADHGSALLRSGHTPGV